METTIAQRIKQIVELKKLNYLSFSKIVGVTNSAISTMFTRNSNPSFELIVGIVTSFNDINSDWLLTGKGEMIKSTEPNQPKNDDQGVNYKEKWIEGMQEVIEVRRELNEANAKIRELLEAELLLKNERKNAVGSAGLATAV